MFQRLGNGVVRLRWAILAGALAVFAAGVLWGLGVFDEFVSGGYFPEDSRVARDADRIEQVFGETGSNLVVLYEGEGLSIEDAEFEKAVEDAAEKMRALGGIDEVTTYYEAARLDPALAAPMASEEGDAVITTADIAGENDSEVADRFQELEPELERAGPLTVRLGGPVAMGDDLNEQIQSDLVTAEAISFPVLLAITVVVFGALVAACLPLLIGALAILGGFTLTHLIAGFADVNVFAANVITIIGLGMSIDYSLFVLRRFREEMSEGKGRRAAVAGTLSTAGRTVFVSGTVIVLSVAGLLLVDLPFLHGIAFGAMSAVAMAMLSAIVVLPAVLYLLGERVEKGRMPWRKGAAADPAKGVWSRVGGFVMNRPWGVLAGTVAFLAVLAAPVLSFHPGMVDENQLPEGAPSRHVSQTVAEDFPGGDERTMDVMIRGGRANSASTLEAVSGLDHVAGMDPVERSGDATLYRLVYDSDTFSTETRDLVTAVRDAGIGDAEVAVQGPPAEFQDSLTALGEGLPWVVLFILAVTFVILFLAFGSAVLPLKAVLMNAFGLAAALGVTVWIFQEGHLSGLLGFTATGYLEASSLLLMGVLMFALSTDYEVFLLSRVREERDAGADNRTAVLRGMQRTGGVITAAAVILIVVVGAFAMSDVVFLQMIGVGMAVAILLDATVVRMLLVPATMRLLGDANWWMPRWSRGLYRRYSIKE
ncbi:MMPL family transporter [Salininema proteolyticum]|uniref:MMPL family transporter n=1 Tax=Salininema proteolyticum TaxID=1607685 RepID=A0ABV8U2R0_9ACTN